MTDSKQMIFSLAAALLWIVSTVPAQAPAPGPGAARPYKLPPDLQKYFKDKYVHVDDLVSSSLQDTPDGPLGTLDLRGRFLPAAPIGGATGEERVRAIALAFIRGEAALLDIPNPAELRESHFRINERGEASVHFYRYAGDLVRHEWRIEVEVDATGLIIHVRAALTPTPAALYQAVTMKTIGEDEVVRVVERDLGRRTGKNVRIHVSRPEKSATWRHPYVVWGVSGSTGDKPEWGYTVDAFTGAILNKACTVHTFVPDPTRTPCD